MHRVIALLLLTLSAVSPVATVAQTPTLPADPEIILQPGDFIRLAIWREEDLSGEFRIDSDGVVTLPMVGAYPVTGMPFDMVQDTLLKAFQVQLRNPSIVITPLRRVNILGDVQEPGMYLVDPTISLVGAVALAGGASASGNLNRIRIVRDGQVVRERVGPSETLGSANVRSNDQIFIGRRSWFNQNLPGILLGLPSLILSIIAVGDRL